MLRAVRVHRIDAITRFEICWMAWNRSVSFQCSRKYCGCWKAGCLARRGRLRNTVLVAMDGDYFSSHTIAPLFDADCQDGTVRYFMPLLLRSL